MDAEDTFRRKARIVASLWFLAMGVIVFAASIYLLISAGKGGVAQEPPARLSSGKAAQLAGMDRVAFLYELNGEAVPGAQREAGVRRETVPGSRETVPGSWSRKRGRRGWRPASQG